ncbi:MAG: hypothetical protein ACI87E_002352 [Mariniblastus sp.]|jgi:hypothetical protein
MRYENPIQTQPRYLTLRWRMLLLVLAFFAVAGGAWADLSAKQIEEAGEDTAVQKTGSQDDAKTKPDEPILDTAQSKPVEIGKQFAQLHLQDGSIIGGEIKTQSIDIKTAYGTLTVPISRIVQIYPGLNSRPEFTQTITELVDMLGGPNSADRDSAQKELISMGIGIRVVLKGLGESENAEQRKRLALIQTAFDEELEANEEELMESERSMVFDDTIVTPKFSIVGEIQQKQFQVKSKFGELKVNLGDIRLADRQLNLKRPDVRKSVAIPAMAFFQTKPHSTGIRVNKGDRIVIRADGVVQWTNWSTSSTPAGLTNRSQWNGINSGKLTARIGTDNSQCVQVGSSGNFVAKRSGILYLGIAMRDSYATSGSYTWTGEYKAKIVVKLTTK